MTAYEMVIGLEIHVELKTESKIFCSCPTTFGAEPNTQCCPVCMGMPGTLPVLNEKAVEYAVKAGLSVGCRIAERSGLDRKNYFYPDLPKAYQISQYDRPLCTDGHIDIETQNGTKRIGVTRIHIEEDAGKLVHHPEKGTLIDYNRCGVPLIEIVSEPDIRSAAEAAAYVKKLRAILLYTGVSDCRMNEGSLRCDVNLSVRKKGENALGIRTEMKNLNSFQAMTRAIEYEFNRQTSVLEAGGKIFQETRRFDPAGQKTLPLRSKEDADDYRYFPEPDLSPIVLSPSYIETLRESIPLLPDARKKIYREKYGLSACDSELLAQEKQIAEYFEAAAEKTAYPRQLANLILSEAFARLGAYDAAIPIAPAHLAAVAQMAGSGRINGATAKRLFHELWERDDDPEAIVAQRGLEQINDNALLTALAKQAVMNDPKSVLAYKNGKTTALKALVGKAMALSGGRANAAKLNELLERELANSE